MTNLQLNLLSFFFLIFGISIRFYNLEFQSFWMDELFSILIASKSSLAEVLSAHQIETNPPFHTIFLFYWIRFFGDSVFAIRLSSAIVGILNLLLLFYLVIKPKYFSKRIYLYSMILFSTCLGGLFYSQEVRAYSLLMCFSLIFILNFNSMLFQIYEDKSIKWITILSLFLFSLLLSYTHYFGFILSGVGLLILFFHSILKFNIKKILTIIAIGSLLILGYSSEILKLISLDTGRVNWIPSPNLLIYLEFLNYIFYFLKGKYFLYFLILFLITFLISIIKKKTEVGAAIERKIIYSYCVMILLVITLTFIVSQFKPIVTARNLLVLIFPLLFIFSYLLNIIKFRRKYIIDFLIVIFSLYMFFQFYRDYLKPHKTDFKSLAQFCIKPQYEDFKLYAKGSQDFYNYYLKQSNSSKRVEALPPLTNLNIKELPDKFILLEADLLVEPTELDLKLLSQSHLKSENDFLGTKAFVYTLK